MLRQKRYAIPCICKHHTFVGSNGINRDNLIKPIRCMDFEMSRASLQLKTWQELLQAHSRPARGTNEITAHRVGDTREGDELMHRFEAPEFVKRQRKRLFDKSIDL